MIFPLEGNKRSDIHFTLNLPLKSNMCVRLYLLISAAIDVWVGEEKKKPNTISEANAIFINLIENERIECSLKQSKSVLN